MTNANETTLEEFFNQPEQQSVKHLEQIRELVSTKLIQKNHEAAESLSIIERQIFVGEHIDFIREEEPFLTEMVNEENAVQKIAADIYAFKKFATAVDYRITFMEELEEAAKKSE